PTLDEPTVRLPALRCHPHHGLNTDTTEDEATSQRPFPYRSGDGRQAETEAPVEASCAGESRLTHPMPPRSPPCLRLKPTSAEPLGARHDAAALHRYAEFKSSNQGAIRGSILNSLGICLGWSRNNDAFTYVLLNGRPNFLSKPNIA
ncbi:hypothetical protein KUCAC02_011166, partial [Chaenocephalus aceratus]